MTHPVAAAIDRFVVLAEGAATMTADHGKMIALLDELAWLAHTIELAELAFDETEYDDPPESNLRRSNEIARVWIPAGIEERDGAVDDLSGILDDLIEIRWRFDHTSEADALFYFQIGFWSHWGHHLRSLQKILHDWY